MVGRAPIESPFGKSRYVKLMSASVKMKLAPTLTRVPLSADMPAGLKKMILGSAA